MVVVVGVSHTTSLRNSCLTVDFFLTPLSNRSEEISKQRSDTDDTAMGANELAVGQVSTAHRRIREGEKPAGGHHANRR